VSDIDLSNRNHTIKTKILVANNFILIRQALRIFIEREKDMEIIAEANDGQEVLNIITTLLPDIVILDSDMPKINGIEVTQQIIKNYPQVKVLVLIAIPESEYVTNLLKAGAVGYIPKNVSGEEIIHAIRVIIGGEMYLPYTVFQNIKQDSIYEKSYLLDNFNKLTPREHQILKMIAKGLSNKDIAVKLGLSERSVKYGITSIFTKFGVKSRTEAISLGLRTRLLNLRDFNL